LLFDPVGDDLSDVASHDIDESVLIQWAEEVDVRSFAAMLDALKSLNVRCSMHVVSTQQLKQV